MAFQLENLPLELLERIALLAALPAPAPQAVDCKHPLPTIPLLFTSRTIYERLRPDPKHNPHFLTLLFRHTFDYAAPARRLGDDFLTSSYVAAEYLRRVRVLTRIRNYFLPGRDGAPPQDTDTHLIEDLWTAYLMLSEHDALNRPILRWACVQTWLWKVVRERLYTTLYGHEDAEVEVTGLLMWCIWMLTTEEEVRVETPQMREAVTHLLDRFAAPGHRYPAHHFPPTHAFLPLHLHTPLHSHADPSAGLVHPLDGVPMGLFPDGWTADADVGAVVPGAHAPEHAVEEDSEDSADEEDHAAAPRTHPYIQQTSPVRTLPFAYFAPESEPRLRLAVPPLMTAVALLGAARTTISIKLQAAASRAPVHHEEAAPAPVDAAAALPVPPPPADGPFLASDDFAMHHAGGHALRRGVSIISPHYAPVRMPVDRAATAAAVDHFVGAIGVGFDSGMDGLSGMEDDAGGVGRGEHEDDSPSMIREAEWNRLRKCTRPVVSSVDHEYDEDEDDDEDGEDASEGPAGAQQEGDDDVRMRDAEDVCVCPKCAADAVSAEADEEEADEHEFEDAEEDLNVFHQGSLSGIWHGLLSCPPHPIPGEQSIGIVAHHPLSMQLREYHLLNSEDDAWLPLGSDEEWEEDVVGGIGHGGGAGVRNAWLPLGTHIRVLEDCLEIRNPRTGKMHYYAEWRPRGRAAGGNYASRWEQMRRETIRASVASSDAESEDAEEDAHSGIYDILVVGETPPCTAMLGKYAYVGRVRMWDGLVCMLRFPIFPPNTRRLSSYGRWIFTGCLQACNGPQKSFNFVGRWRDTVVGGLMGRYEGGFVVSR